ncbi:hypothetical protein F5Y19DRAFT_450410 [Xylariaceae sp. FL1651]|nr:hypothetical protein F5Y19DRAFT_450410 [Xylariaceae sp. FL1651]
MLFSKIFAPVAMAATAFAAATPQQVADSINSLTQKSQALQNPAQSITLINAPLIVIGQGPFPQLITGFTDIVSTATVLVSQLQGFGPVQKRAVHARDFSVEERGLEARGPDADLIFNAFRGFVRVHQELLNILIGKAGILEKVPVVGQPVATVLRQVEGVVDTIAITLINTVESRSKDLEAEANSLGNTLDLTIQKYSLDVNV